MMDDRYLDLLEAVSKLLGWGLESGTIRGI